MSLRRKTIEDIELTNKKILVRLAELDVAIEDGKILDNHRILASLHTIKFLMSKNVKAIIMITHLGKPHGQKLEKLSVKPVADELQKLLDREIIFVHECIGPNVDDVCNNPVPGSIILLENLGFHIEEEGKVDEDGRKIRVEESTLRIFRDSLSKLGDVYVNDAFSAAHMWHCSINQLSNEIKVAGLLMKKEIDSFAKLLEKPLTPFAVILGGSKMVDKMLIIEHLLERITDLIFVGDLAYTFLKATNKMEIGKSNFDEDGAKLVPRIIEKAKFYRVNLILPVDFVTGDKLDEKATMGKAKIKDGIKGDNIGLDIGADSLKKISQSIMKSKTLLWTGYPGMFEWEVFSKGTEGLISWISIATKKGTTTVACGKDTIKCIEKFKAFHKFTHVSLGSEAGMLLLEGWLVGWLVGRIVG
ncbi:hypothetical protein HELRODRAFT_80463 [Helobdella robusta]|uniref:Phosphoglycerate kinase n=1 Tax=Helobdella robusta TaxID=6412 RepID=T1G412_HELRO|nr:hypothetical protein HELRODRAFT_80463 [Helobdella robusta]ESO03328.1 hypothetical protein HELRODRAFT_80463 [Helobdella robusta]